MRFLDILVVSRLDVGQISFNMVEKAFATQQFALLATTIAFDDILARACTEIKWPTSLGFSIFEKKKIRFSFFSFSFLFAAVIGVLLGLLAVKDF